MPHLLYFGKFFCRDKTCLRQHLVDLIDAIVQQIFACYYQAGIVIVDPEFTADVVHKIFPLMRLVHSAHEVSIHGTDLLAEEELFERRYRLEPVGTHERDNGGGVGASGEK